MNLAVYSIWQEQQMVQIQVGRRQKGLCPQSPLGHCQQIRFMAQEHLDNQSLSLEETVLLLVVQMTLLTGPENGIIHRVLVQVVTGEWRQELQSIVFKELKEQTNSQEVIVEERIKVGILKCHQLIYQ